jgi:hypothetical protein
VNGELLEFQGFEWDETKSQATLAYRAFDFEIRGARV